MKNSMKLPIPLSEIEQLINQGSDEPIWLMRIKSKWTMIYLIGGTLMAALYMFSGNWNIGIGLIILINAIHLFYIASTMKYTIFSDRISFDWWLFGKKRVDIPFEDIVAINLVTYNDSPLSTIHFGTKSAYKIKKIDFDTREDRPHITFERVKNGEMVYELLNQLWEINKYKNS